MKKNIILVLVVLVSSLLLSGCTSAEIASHNISKEADYFNVNRRIVFYNGINGEYILTIEGFCSIQGYDPEVSIICKTGNDKYKKHILGISDNVTYFAEQIDAENVSPNHYKVIFKPSAIAPDIEIK